METPCTPTSNCKGGFNKDSSPLLVPQTPFLIKIGFGTGVSVYHLHRSPRFGNEPSPWAIKIRNARALRGNITEMQYKEDKIMRSLDHPNIVGFLEDGNSCKKKFLHRVATPIGPEDDLQSSADGKVHSVLERFY